MNINGTFGPLCSVIRACRFHRGSRRRAFSPWGEGARRADEGAFLCVEEVAPHQFGRMTYGRAIESIACGYEDCRGRKSWPHVLSPKGRGERWLRESAGMNINGKAYRTIWLGTDGWSVEIIDQTKLPHELAFVQLTTLEDAARAILTMQVRGAPLIGATAAYGVCLALREDASDEALDRADRSPGEAAPHRHQSALGAGRDARAPCATCRATSASPPPTSAPPRSATPTSRPTAPSACTGRKLIEAIAARKRPGERVNVLTHCNAGWLACVDWRHRARAHLRGARSRHRPACVGRRDAAAQPGRGAHRLRARRARRAAHHHRRQRRRAPDAARAWWICASSAPTASPPTATPPTRSAHT